METLPVLNLPKRGTSLLRHIVKIWRSTGESRQEWRIQRSNREAIHWIRIIYNDLEGLQQGWKLHISAEPLSAETVLHRVVPLLLEAKTSFKLLGSPEELATFNQGAYGLSQIGKFITIYPRTDEVAVRLARLIDQATEDLSGPSVLSDRPLHPRSLVHYRYGGFHDDQYIQELSGNVLPVIKTPDNTFVPDKRNPYYSAPLWTTDPFVAAGIATDTPQQRQRLYAGRYLITHTISVSPMHAVYLAMDLQSLSSCIMKGPGLAWEHVVRNTDVDQALRNEAHVLSLLETHTRVPKLYACLEHNGHPLLVMEDIQGETLTDTVNTLVRSAQQISVRQAISWAKELAEVLNEIHAHELVHADVKPSNVLIDAKGHIHLIDFELTCKQGYQYPSNYGTKGYTSPERRSGLPLSIADDIYGFGAILYFMVTGADPSLAPQENALLNRPPECFSEAGGTLKEIIERCLHRQVGQRYASLIEVLQALEALDTTQDSSFRAIQQHTCSPVLEDAVDPVTGENRYHRLSMDLLETLSREARYTKNREAAFWVSSHPLTHGLTTCDLNTGNAGTILALAELVGAHPSPRKRKLLEDAARWLTVAPIPHGKSLPGLYVGKAGAGAALLRAGQIMHDQKCIDTALEHGKQIAHLPFGSPDLFHGTAGRLRFHLFLWDETGEYEQLLAACACGEHLLSTSQTADHAQKGWTIPEGYGEMSGRTFLGYAHGTAGIADALLDLFEATGEHRYLEKADEVGHYLEIQVVVSQESTRVQKVEKLNWPEHSGGNISSAFWCHGSTGIGRFFLHLAQCSGNSWALEIASGAAQAAAQDVKWAGPTQCHGLAGSIEFLLDMYLFTKQQSYKKEAFRLATLLQAFVIKQNGNTTISSESPMTVTPDYMVGYAGIALCLLRLGSPEYIPHQLSRAGFRYRHQPKKRSPQYSEHCTSS